jgi:hypothetical protein
MDEGFGDLRQVVVDYVRDILHVDSAGSDIGGDKDAIAPLLKARQRGNPLRLRAVTVNHRYGKTFAAQFPCDAFGSALGARKDQTAARFLAEQPVKHSVLPVGSNLKSLDAHILRWL